MAFNVLSRNCDDHTKNFAFLMDQAGKWSLSPAYDVCHAYRPESLWVSQHALSINGKRDQINKEDLLEIARRMNIKKANVILQQFDKVVKQWHQYSNMVSVNKKLSEAIQQTHIRL